LWLIGGGNIARSLPTVYWTLGYPGVLAFREVSMNDAIPLIFEELCFSIDADDNLVITVFSSNFGPVEVRFPLMLLADYTGRLLNAYEETED
jgi:hypothetical protein